MTRTIRTLSVSLLAIVLGAALPAAAQEAAATALAYTGATSAPHAAPLAAQAGLTTVVEDPETGEDVEAGVPGKDVVFTLRDQDGTELAEATATTGEDGTASATIALDFAVGDGYEIDALFAGDEEYLPSSSGPVQVSITIAGSTLNYTGPTGGVRGQTISLSARLQHATTGAGLAGRVVLFEIPGLLDATATTNTAGTASVSFKLDAMYGTYPLSMSWEGGEGFTGSSGQQNIAIRWTWTFTSDQGLGAVYLNATLQEFRVVTPGADSGIVTGATIQNHTPNFAGFDVITAHYAGADVSLELVGEARGNLFGRPFQAAGHIGTTPYALYRIGII